MRFNGRKENLHSLWDTVLVELEQGTPAEIAQRIQAMVSSNEVQQWRQGTPADWALESLAIVREQVYRRLPASGEITVSYIEAARAVIRTRLAQAGARWRGCLIRPFSKTAPSSESEFRLISGPKNFLDKLYRTAVKNGA